MLMRDAETTPHIAIKFLFFIIHFIHNYFRLHTSFHIIENSIISVLISWHLDMKFILLNK